MNHYLWMWQTRKKLCPIWALSFSTYIDSTVMRNIIISMFHRHKNLQLLYRCRMINFRIDRKIKCLLFLKKKIIIKKQILSWLLWFRTCYYLKNWSRIKIPDNLPSPMSSEMFKSLRHLFLGWDREEPFEAEQKPQFGPLTCWPTIEVHYMEKNPGMFSSKTLNYLIFHWIKKKKTRTSWMTWDICIYLF